jgi:hypothetical protein
LSLSLSPPASLARASVWLPVSQSVLDSYARRAQAGGVTVSQQKHLICPASQRLPAAVIVQPALFFRHLYYCNSLPIRISPFPSLPQLVAHLVRCPTLSLQIPFAARRLHPARPAFSFLTKRTAKSCYHHQPHHQLLPTHSLPLAGLEPGTDPTAALTTYNISPGRC